MGSGDNQKSHMSHKWIIAMAFSAVIPLVIMIITYALKGIYPGGKFTILVSDLYKQYMPLYASLRYLFDGESNLFYYFFGALGTNNTGTYAYYVSNPISWISVLFSLKNLPDYFYYVTLIRFSLTGLFFCIYLYNAFPKKRNLILAVLASCCYALTSYNIIYSFNLMWLDIVMLLPLLMLGIEYIINDKKGILFSIILILCFLFNFYLTYIAGVFSVIYILYRLIYENKKHKALYFFRYIKCSLLSFGIMAPFLVVAVSSVLNGKGKETDGTSATFFFHSIPQVLKQLLPCQYDTIETYGLPSIYCGLLFLILFASSFALKDINRRQKVLNAVIFIIFFASFIILPLDNFWHGFREVVFFPARYSFAFCFFIICVAYQTFGNVYERLTEKKIIKVENQRLIYGLVIAFTCIELFLNSGYVISSLSTQTHYRLRAEYERYIADITPVLNDLSQDDSFYRVSFDNPYTMCEGAFLGCNAIGWYSSSYNRDSLELFGSLGYEQWNHYLRDCGGTPFTESIFGVKYKISYMDKSTDLDYTPLDYTYPYTVYMNPEVVSLGFAYNDSDYKMFTEDVFCNQNILSNELTGCEEDIFEPIEYEMKEMISDDFPYCRIISFVSETTDAVWMYVNDAPAYEITGWLYSLPDSEWAGLIRSIQLMAVLPDGSKVPFFTENKNYSICVGEFNPGEKIDIQILGTIPFDEVYLYSFDETVYESVMNEVHTSELIVEECNSGKISSKIFVPDNKKNILITLPYMDGYKILIDGQESEYNSYRNALLSVLASPGEHIIEISFMPPGIILGLLTGLICIVLSALLHIIEARVMTRVENS